MTFSRGEYDRLLLRSLDLDLERVVREEDKDDDGKDVEYLRSLRLCRSRGLRTPATIG